MSNLESHAVKNLVIRQEEIEWSGSSIEARLYAEDPSNDFLPVTGKLIAYEPDSNIEARWDTGVEQGSIIGTDFDPMIAKVISTGKSRTDAANKLALALESLHIGGVITNRDFLVSSLRSEAFHEGLTTSDFIEKVDPQRSVPMSGENLELSSSVAALWIQGLNRKNSKVLNQIPSGWRNSKLPQQKLSFRCLEEEATINYIRRRDGSFSLNNGSVANIFKWEESGIDIEIDGRRFYAKVTQDSKTIVVHMPWGNAVLEILPRFTLPGSEVEAGGLIAPMPGKVIDLKVKVGSKVKKGDTLVILEAMKMEHQVKASEDGKVTKLLVKKDEQLENGTLLMIVEPK